MNSVRKKTKRVRGNVMKTGKSVDCLVMKYIPEAIRNSGI
jgi:hypothetical protein